MAFIFCLINVKFTRGQTPVIVPKQQPIILHLDNTGNYTVSLADIATIKGVSSSVTISPLSFNCSTTGPQMVTIVADNDNQLNHFKKPIALASDATGNIYVADQLNYVVKKIHPDGTIEILAGSGVDGNNDGTGNAASFGLCLGIAVDAAGNVYLTDFENNEIRKITQAGVVTTIIKSSGRGNADGTIATATFSNLHNIVIDKAGNFYVADANLIRKIAPDGNVTTIPNTNFKDVTDMALDNAGNLFVADYGNNVIKEITTDGAIFTYAGSGKAGSADGDRTIASFYFPSGIDIDADGNLFVADSYNNRIRKIAPNGDVSTFAGNGESKSVDGTGILASFSAPSGIVVSPNGDMYVADANSGKIRVITKNGKITTIGGDDNNHSSTAIIPVTVVSFSELQTHPDVTVMADEHCQAILPDYTIDARVTNICNEPVTITQSPAAGTILKGNTPVTVTLSAVDKWGISGSTTFTATLVNSPAQLPVVTIAPNLVNTCPGTPVTFEAVVVNGVAVAGYQWQVNGITSGPNSAEFTTSALKDGDKVICAVTATAGCAAPVPGNTFVAHVTAIPEIVFGNNEVIYPGGSIKLNPVITGDVVSYQWVPKAGLNDSDIKQPIASPVITTTYHLTVKTAGGCQATASTIITVINQVPNTFTPNSDGVNDTWNLDFLTGYPDCTVDVFSRYGQLVYHSQGYSNAFNGNYNGKPLPTGTYYYIIHLKSSNQDLAGFLTIMR